MSADQSSVIIEAIGLKKVFKDFWGRPKVSALKGIDVKVQTGHIHALLGPNGSGKTTFIKILLGLLFPSSGTVQIFNQNAFDTSNKARIGFLPEKSYFYDHLTGRETLHFYGKLLGLPKTERRDRVEELLKLTQMEHQAHRPLSEYSLGMSRRIGIAQALLADPELLILDEPTGGLDPLGIEEIHELIRVLKEKGKTILICTHLLAESEDICDELTILYQGEVLVDGRLKELKEAHNTPNMKALFMKVLNEKRGKAIEKLTEEKEKQEAEAEPAQGPDEDYLKSLSNKSSEES